MIRKINSKLEKVSFPIVAVILAAIIGIVILFVNPIVGVANDGDYYRTMGPNNLYYLNEAPGNKPEFFYYFQNKYGISDFYNTNKEAFFSTQNFLIKPAIVLSKIFNGDSNIFDLRFLAGILLAIQLIATYLITKFFCSYLRTPIMKLLMVGVYLFIFMDIGYIAYFNSLYGEGVEIPFFLLTLGLLLEGIRFKKITWYRILLIMVVSIIFFGSKQQLFYIGALVAILLFRIMYYYRKKSVKIAVIIGALVLVSTTFILYGTVNNTFINANKYDSLNNGVLLNSENPGNILREMDISRQYSLLKNTSYFDKVSQIDLKNKTVMGDYYNQYGFTKIILYYLSHPDEFYKIMKIGFENGYYIRPDYDGNYLRSSGKPPLSKSYFWSGWSSLKANFIPKNILISLVYIGAFLYFSIKRFKKGNREKKLIEEVFWGILIVGVSQIVMSIMGAGISDIAKHELLYNLSFDFLLIVVLKELFIKVEERWLKNG